MDSQIPVPRFAIVGSERKPPSDAEPVATLDRAGEHAKATARVTVVVRRRAAPPAPGSAPLSREEFASRYGADPADIAAVEAFAKAGGARVVAVDPARRSIELEATLATFAELFEANMVWYRRGGETFRARTGPLTVPATLAPIVTGVFGIDVRPQARAQFRFHPAAAAPASYSPRQVAAAYGFPPSADGTGQTIALIELGGGYVQSDLDAYFTSLGLKSPQVSSVAVDGGSNAPTGDPSSADGEVMLDIEVAGAIAPGAKIVVYFAPNTDKGFLDAVTTAIHDTQHTPSVVSISWGGPESSWTAQATTNFDDAFADAAALGVTVTVASGDNGSSDGVTDGSAHVDFPASSPHVLACGGTALRLDSSGGIGSESVWNDGPGGGAGGGGVSDIFALPDYQTSANVPVSANGARIGRGVPDVAGDADPQTGYTTRVDGTQGVVGGTSAVAPLWAAFVALVNQQRGTPLGFLNARLYALALAQPASFHDIVTGSNGAYSALAGWDACTGLGTPNGSVLALALQAAPPQTPAT